MSAARGQAQHSSWDTGPVLRAAPGSLPLPRPTGQSWQWERVPAACPSLLLRALSLRGTGWGAGALGGRCLEQSCLSHQSREVCLPACSPGVQPLELFVRLSVASRGGHGAASLTSPSAAPNIKHNRRTPAFDPPAPQTAAPLVWRRPHRCSRTDAPRGRSPRPAAPRGSPAAPPTTPLTGWGGRAVAANRKLVLERGQGARRGESTQHRGEEEGVGGHRVPIEVPSPRCRAGAAVAGHARQPQSEGRRTVGQETPAGFRPPHLGAWGLGPEGVWVVSPPPLLSWSCGPRLASSLQPPGAPTLAWGQGLGAVPRAGPLVKQFRELALSWEGPELAFRTWKRMPLLDDPWVGGRGGHVLRCCRKRRDR